MKLFLISALSLICSIVYAAPSTSTLQLLTQMNDATKQLDYEIYYVRVRKNNIEPMRYRHASINKQRYAQLAYLSGTSREMIRRAGEVTYFEPGFDPYTITSDQIMAPLPVIPRNFTRLRQHYNFVSLGRSREAGLSSEVIRISPKDGARYSYVLWIDEKTSLLLRADLLDENGELLEQTRTIKLTVSPAISEEMQKLATLKLPPAMKQLKRNKLESNWEIGTLPKGFLPVTHNTYRLMQTARPVENLMFSDGLFSFSIYFSKVDGLSAKEQIVRSGRRTLYSQTRGDVEIAVVGDIPPEVAEKIVKSVRFKAPTSNFLR